MPKRQLSWGVLVCDFLLIISLPLSIYIIIDFLCHGAEVCRTIIILFFNQSTYWYSFFHNTLSGKDHFGETLTKKATEAGVNVNYQIHSKEPTGTCAVLITGKDRSGIQENRRKNPMVVYNILFSSHHCRSLVANLAAANCYSKTEHLDKEENWALVQNAQFIYIGVRTGCN